MFPKLGPVDESIPVFPLPGIAVTDTTPFEQLHVWQWARDQSVRRDVTIGKYLTHIGFVPKQFRLTEPEYDVLANAIDHFHWVAPHVRGEFKLSDIFDNGDLRSPAFYVQGLQHRRKLSAVFKTALENAGWIYDVNPLTTYFQISPSGIVWAKYQQIIGQRALAQLAKGEF